MRLFNEYTIPRPIVYCPTMGYCLARPDHVDTGKAFELESQAERFVIQLRKAGHHAWMENSGQ